MTANQLLNKTARKKEYFWKILNICFNRQIYRWRSQDSFERNTSRERLQCGFARGPKRQPLDGDEVSNIKKCYGPQWKSFPLINATGHNGISQVCKKYSSWPSKNQNCNSCQVFEIFIIFLFLNEGESDWGIYQECFLIKFSSYSTEYSIFRVENFVDL